MTRSRYWRCTIHDDQGRSKDYHHRCARAAYTHAERALMHYPELTHIDVSKETTEPYSLDYLYVATFTRTGNGITRTNAPTPGQLPLGGA